MEHLNPEQVLAAFGATLGVLLILFAVMSRRESRIARTAKGVIWKEVARRLGGTFDHGGNLDRIRFKWNGRDATLLQESEVVFKIGAGAFGTIDLELQSQDRPMLGSGLKRLAGLPQVFHRGSDLAFLSDPVRQVVRDLQEIGGPYTAIVIDQHLRVSGRPGNDAKSLTRFAILCLQLAQHAKLFVEQSSAVRVLEAGTVSGGVCQVCGAELGGQRVNCSRCSTPHHADCWEYAGVCSTYGCGSKSAAGV